MPPPTHPISIGDIALILGRYKTMHFIRLALDAPAPKQGDVLVLTYDKHGHQCRLPVRITAATLDQTNSPLDASTLKATGRITGKKKPLSEPLSDTIPDAPLTARAIARQIVAREEPEFLEELYASSVAGEGTGPIYALTIRTLRNPTEDFPAKDLISHYRTCYEVAAPIISAAHAYEFKNGAQGEISPPPEQKSSVNAIRYLKTHYKPVNLDLLLKRMREPHESISAQKKLESQPVAALPTTPADGARPNEQLLAGLPQLCIPLGTAMLVEMGAITRIASLSPAVLREKGTHTVTVLHTTPRRHNPRAHEYAFTTPVHLLHAGQEAFPASDITPERALAHGFLDPQHMRNALGITSVNDPRPIHSYAFVPAKPSDVPLDADRAGSHLVARQKQAYAIWKDTPDSSVTSSISFLHSLSKEQRYKAESRIIPPDEQSPELQAAHTVPWNHAGTRPIPRDLHAAREAGAAPPAKEPRHPFPAHAKGRVTLAITPCHVHTPSKAKKSSPAKTPHNSSSSAPKAIIPLPARERRHQDAIRAAAEVTSGHEADDVRQASESTPSSPIHDTPEWPPSIQQGKFEPASVLLETVWPDSANQPSPHTRKPRKSLRARPDRPQSAER